MFDRKLLLISVLCLLGTALTGGFPSTYDSLALSADENKLDDCIVNVQKRFTQVYYLPYSNDIEIQAYQYALVGLTKDLVHMPMCIYHYPHSKACLVDWNQLQVGYNEARIASYPWNHKGVIAGLDKVMARLNHMHDSCDPDFPSEIDFLSRDDSLEVSAAENKLDDCVVNVETRFKRVMALGHSNQIEIQAYQNALVGLTKDLVHMPMCIYHYKHSKACLFDWNYLQVGYNEARIASYPWNYKGVVAGLNKVMARLNHMHTSCDPDFPSLRFLSKRADN